MTFEEFINNTTRSNSLAFGLGLSFMSVIFLAINMHLWVKSIKGQFDAGNFPFEFWNNVFTGFVVISIIFILYGTYTRKPKE